ncbi:K02A2.6-like [Cordylochernes scorpioides]|uniref:K02A2.6-like n=1 Tax=Cordylochernes scorpioides TaxID=51811 RepID=A0ABY6LJ99_9ARAC|nr:K02A2.6-like [Cordylochernes scorpioides]
MENKRDRAAKGNGKNLVERRKTTRRTLAAIIWQLTIALRGVNTTRRERTYRTPDDGTADAHATAVGRGMDGGAADTWPNDLMRHSEESPPTMPNPYTSIRKNASVPRSPPKPETHQPGRLFGTEFETEFIPDHARLRTPLVNLLKRDVMWVWDDECQKAFTSLKESLTTHPTLHLYQEGVLKQVYPDGKTYTVQNFSRSLRAHERSYSNSELQCLAIVESVDNFRALHVVQALIIMSVLLAETQILGLRNILRTRGQVRWFKGLLFLGSCLGFLYQIVEFSRIAFSFPVVLNIEIVYPESILVPAVTLCTGTRYPDKCYTVNNIWHVKEEYQNADSSPTNEDLHYMGYKFDDIYFLDDLHLRSLPFLRYVQFREHPEVPHTHTDMSSPENILRFPTLKQIYMSSPENILRFPTLKQICPVQRTSRDMSSPENIPMFPTLTQICPVQRTSRVSHTHRYVQSREHPKVPHTNTDMSSPESIPRYALSIDNPEVPHTHTDMSSPENLPRFPTLTQICPVQRTSRGSPHSHRYVQSREHPEVPHSHTDMSSPENILRFPTLTDEGHITECFVMNHQLFGVNRTAAVLMTKGKFIYKIFKQSAVITTVDIKNTHFEKNKRPYIFSIHSPHEIANPYHNGFRIPGERFLYPRISLVGPYVKSQLIHTLVRPRCIDCGEDGWNKEMWQFIGMSVQPVTSARVDRHILRQAVAAPQATCTAILQHVQDTLDHSISTRTISRRLVANGLHSCRPLRRLPLTPPNRRQRLEWCRARSAWMTEWHMVVFSDESRFCLSSDSRRVRVWRRRGERSNPAAIVERPTVRQRGIMVWGAIAYDSRSPLLRIQGTMTAQRYVDDVLRPVTLPYLQGVPNALYQQDNARPHTVRISQQALQDVQMLPWPPYSPELSPIEHVWDIIGRRLHALPQPRSEDELWQMVEREWRTIPQDAIHTLIDSLPRCVAACIAVRGSPTCY